MPSWLPNAITIFRFLLVPVFLVAAMACDAAVLRGESGAVARWWTVGALIAIGLSDVVDGMLARRFGAATQLGATLDAAADKFAQVVSITYFTLAGGHAFYALPLWFMLLLIVRDALIAGSWLYLRSTGEVHVEHNWHGKLASSLMFGLIVWVSAGGGRNVGLVLVVVIAVTTTLSTVAYAREGTAQLAARRAPGPPAGAA